MYTMDGLRSILKGGSSVEDPQSFSIQTMQRIVVEERNLGNLTRRDERTLQKAINFLAVHRVQIDFDA